MSAAKTLESALISRGMDPAPWLAIYAAADCHRDASRNARAGKLSTAISIRFAVSGADRVTHLRSLRAELVEPARSGPKFARYRAAITAIDALIAELTPEPTP